MRKYKYTGKRKFGLKRNLLCINVNKKKYNMYLYQLINCLINITRFELTVSFAYYIY